MEHKVLSWGEILYIMLDLKENASLQKFGRYISTKTKMETDIFLYIYFYTYGV